jgi:hypothetical protein
MSTETQTLNIQRHLAKGHALTPLDALKRFGTMRLGARIYDLKQQGWPITTKLVDVGNGRRVAEYSLGTGK